MKKDDAKDDLGLSKLTIEDDYTRDDHPYTEEEKQAVIDVRKILVTDKGLNPSNVSEIELIFITLTCKCRVDEAVKKFMIYHEDLIQKFEVTNVWADQKELIDEYRYNFAMAGTDKEGRQISWVTGNRLTENNKEAESIHIRACLLYNMAVVADLHTLRNGICMVIVTNKKKKKSGNEKRLQVAYQTIPSRPQAIYIVGTNTIMRVAINVLIALASVFSNSKVIGRVQFASLEKVEEDIAENAIPDKFGGDKKIETHAWVKERLDNFPRMDLPALTWNMCAS